MAFAPLVEVECRNVAGQFRHAETGRVFDYTPPRETPFEGYAARVFVLDGFRYAKVLKTVAYVVVDEDADGGPVVEKWSIRGHRIYG